jgi:hypothetical protein
LFKKKNQCQI